MKIILHWVILAAAVYASAYVIPGVHVATIITAFIVAACLAFINLTIKPIMTVLTLPVTIITLGLFSLVLNGLFFYFVASFVSGFSVASFAAAFWGALLVSAINWIGDRAFHLS